MPVPVRLNTGILGLAFIKLYFELSIYTILFLSYFQQHNITLVFSGRFLNLSAAWSVFNFRPSIYFSLRFLKFFFTSDLICLMCDRPFRELSLNIAIFSVLGKNCLISSISFLTS